VAGAAPPGARGTRVRKRLDAETAALQTQLTALLGGDTVARSGLRVEREGPVVTISLARPDKRNPQRPETWRTLAGVGELLPPEVRIVVVRGDGRSFSAGIDLSVLAEQAGGELPDEDRIAGFQAGFTWLSRPGLVSIAVVSGHAVGAGFQLALACDLRLLGDDAQFAMAETSIGLVPDLGGTQALVAAVGYARALEICLTGRRISATEAAALGLATAVVPVTELPGALDDLVAALLAPRQDAAVATKALLVRARDHPGDREGSLAAERAAQVRRFRALTGMVD
jgi:enoyl-CoA hydratase/carnithine racemase